MANRVESCIIASPNGRIEECAKFIIDDVTTPFVMHDFITIGKEYTFSFWVQSEVNGSIWANNSEFQTTPAWSHRCVATFVADRDDLVLTFDVAGAYYIYHPQLENGNRATDWAPSPDDVRAEIDAVLNILDDKIRMAVTSINENGNAQSVMTQTENGWTFDISKVEDKTARENVSTLTGRVDEKFETLDAYIYMGEYEGQPCIELGDRREGNDAKLRITNTQIQFTDGMFVPAYIANEDGVSKMMIEKAEVKGELQIGNYVWQKRDNGNVGLMWNGNETLLNLTAPATMTSRMMTARSPEAQELTFGMDWR